MGITESKLSANGESYMKTETPSRRNPDVKTVPQCLEHFAETLPDKEAVVFVSTNGDREAVTFKDVYEKSKRVAYNLLSLGVKPGDIVAISLRTCPEWLFATFGAMIAGAIPFPVPFTYKDGSDIVKLFERMKCCTCMVMEPGYQDENWKIFSKMIDSYSDDGRVASKKLPSLRYLVGYKHSIPKAKSFDDLIMDDGSTLDLPEIDEDAIAIFLQTSGSTGVPKIITHSHRSLMTVTDITFGPAFSANDVFLSERTFSWVGGFPFSLLFGQTRVTCSGMCPLADDMAAFLMDIIRQEQCHIVAGLPPLIHQMLKRKILLDEKWSLKTIAMAGQPITESNLRCLGQVCKYIIVLYGGSEQPCVSANVLADFSKFTEHNCGQLLVGQEIKIVDANGEIVPVGESGELYTRGNNLFKGYHNDPDRTRAVFTEDGWYRTDDAARMLQDGSLIVEGRISNKINVGGFKVSPEIMEEILKSCPGVESAVVVPVPDDIQNQVLVACVKVATGSSVTEAVLRIFCENAHGDKQRSFTVLPKYYLIMKSFPELVSGKVSRKALESIAKDKFVK